MRRLMAGLVLGAAMLGSAVAAPIEEFLLDGVRYDPSIETPDEHFRHGLGDKPVRHDQMISYLKGLAAASDRISVETIGYTHEGREILFLVATSPENHQRLDDIKKAHLAKVTGEGAGEDLPSVVWINYGVHGAESAGMDAAIPSLYHFAAAQGDAIENTLANSVILIAAILNPDGHARRIDHVETFGGKVAVTDPAHAQHNLWTAARTNHYWFDLNRQWLPVTQPESMAWVSKWQEWKPQVSADFHEMGSQSTYYFHPGEPKRLNPIIPDRSRELAKGIAEYHRAFLDKEARLYFTEQGFDNFYIGKGSTYPQVNGSIGILFEVGAARGGAIESPSGERSYADNIRTHFRTTLTTVEGTLALKDEIHAYHKTFFEEAKKAAAEDPVKGYVFTTHGDQSRLKQFLHVLMTHNIKVHRLAEEVSAGELSFDPETSFVVPMDQRQYRMIRGVFDRVTEFEENVFYDVSGWTLPLAYDLDYAPMKASRSRGEAAASFSSSVLGDEVTSVDDLFKKPAFREAKYGYVFAWSDHHAPKALYKLLDAEALVRVAREPFEVRTPDGLRTFEAGSVFVPMARQPFTNNGLHKLVREVSEGTGIAMHPVSSGAGDVATASLGGASFRPVTKPSVLLLFEDGLARYDAGEIWHLLDHQMEMPVTLRRKDALAGLDWSRYTHLVMVGGGNVALRDDVKDRVQQWIREEGGTLIAMRQSAKWAETALSSEKKADKKPVSAMKEDEPKRLDFSEMGLRDAEHIIGGAIVATDIDTTHPLGFGYGDRFLPVLRNSTLTLQWPEGNPYAVAAAYPDDKLVLSGYVSDKRADELSGTPAVVATRYGRGRMVLMADNPAFRAMFVGSNKVFLNAIFFSGLIDNPSGDYTAMVEE